jgi:hypothetical protein
MNTSGFWQKICPDMVLDHVRRRWSYVSLLAGGANVVVAEAGGSAGVSSPAPKPHAEHVARSKQAIKNRDLAMR